MLRVGDARAYKSRPYRDAPQDLIDKTYYIYGPFCLPLFTANVSYIDETDFFMLLRKTCNKEISMVCFKGFWVS
jgi:hypothetical protein